MDFQHRAGGKTGTGGVASWSETNRDRRERLRQLALETIDLNKDPYFMKNHLGSYECKLCLTLHNNEGSYLAHTQGKKHQANLARRAAKAAKESSQQPAPAKPRVDIKKFLKIGRPGYRVTKQRDRENGQQSLLFQIDYSEIGEGIAPQHRFMSAYEQKVEPPDRRWQYLLFAAEPYETIAFKVPSREVDKSEGKFWVMCNKDTKQFFLQLSFKVEPKNIKLPAPPNAPPGQPQNQRLNAPMQNVPPPPPPAPMMSRPMGMPPPPPPNSITSKMNLINLEKHLGIVVMTTQPNFVPDLPTVNNNGNAVMPLSNQQQSEPQNLSSSQTSESQGPTTSSQTNTLSPKEITTQESPPLSLAKVLVPAQVAVVAHSFSEQQSQQQSVLFQALTAQSAPHFIALTAVSSSDTERHEITVPGARGVSCVQYIDEGVGTNVFSSPNSQMTTFSIYTTPETASMYTPNSTTYYNSASNSENYSQVSVNEDQGQDSGCQSFNEDQDVFQVLDESNMTESENSHMSCYPSSRLSAASMKWLVDNYEMADGMSVPRSTMYNHYLKHCSEQKMEALNAASFGKLIRMVFNSLRTRRLGTRGNSKYHYYGIRLKPSSSINKAMEDIVNTTYRHNSFMHMRRLKTEHNVNAENNNNCNGKRFFEADESDKKRPAPAQPKSHHVYLGDASTAIPDVEIELDATLLPGGITLEKITLFRDAYRKHCENILEAVVNFQFSEVESLWHEFWNTSNENRSKSDTDLTKPFMLEIVNFDPIKEFIKQTDYQFYQNLVDVLIPDVLRPIPSTLTQAIRNFAKSLEGWLRAAITECGDNILNIKISAISAFSQTLRRYTSLNHLAQAARAVLQSSTQIKQMTSDLNKVDFRNIQEQASWVCQCEDGIIRQILTEFRQTLQHNLWLEDWASWLENIVHKTLEPHEGKPTYPKAARQFLLKWSFYSSLVIRDLTLRSAASFGSFHLLRLLYDEFMFYVIEHCIAKATGTTSISVMGEYLHSGKPEQLSDMPESLNNSAVCSDISENDPNECIIKEESSQECEIPVSQE